MRRFGFVFGPDGAGPYSALNNEGICRYVLRRVRIHGGLIEPALPVVEIWTMNLSVRTVIPTLNIQTW